MAPRLQTQNFATGVSTRRIKASNGSSCASIARASRIASHNGKSKPAAQEALELLAKSLGKNK